MAAVTQWCISVCAKASVNADDLPDTLLTPPSLLCSSLSLTAHVMCSECLRQRRRQQSRPDLARGQCWHHTFSNMLQRKRGNSKWKARVTDGELPRGRWRGFYWAVELITKSSGHSSGAVRKFGSIITTKVRFVSFSTLRTQTGSLTVKWLHYKLAGIVVGGGEESHT